MDSKLHDILTDRESNHLLPFFWMHDGHHDELPHLIQQVYDSGARAFCVESRPHKDFAGPTWWADMDVILEEARKRDMKVWILDDQHFPTGYCNGLIAKQYPHLRKWHLIENHVDVIGPARENAILLANPSHPGDDDDILLGVYAFRRINTGETLDAEPIDLTGNVHGRYVYWDIPEGIYRIFSIYKSRRGADHKDYAHLIDPDSTHVLIEAVYEPHYEHYSEYFGNTIAGFFSDEPSLGNMRFGENNPDPDCYNQRLGQPGLALPWTDELLAVLQEKLGNDVLSKAPALWFDQNGAESEIRLAYMDALTLLWRKHFSLQVGSWCREHGVEYIGHIIEDMNCHARLTRSGGHFFRSLDGQDMAGIDVVLHQIMPGFHEHIHAAHLPGNNVDPEFFDYMLARLAASHSHIQPRMKNRAMCEIFGAYGWAEGVPMMKNLMDHMLVRGVNHFVPHAFSPKYPDPDCPPHFGAGGFNPQFSAFARLMKYTNQVTHLLSDGIEQVSAAILYHAEAEWSGQDYMLTQKPAKVLYDSQLNYDILPIDAIIEQAFVKDGALCVEQMKYPVLIVPYAALLPKAFLEKLSDLEAQGLRLVFVEGKPIGYTGGTVVSLDALASYVRSIGAADVTLGQPFPQLRVLHVKRSGTDVFMLVNESMSKAYEGEITLPVEGIGTRLDLLMDKISQVSGGKVSLRLECGQSTLLVFGETGEALPEKPLYREAAELNAQWTLSMKPALPGGEYSAPVQLDELYNVAGPKGDPAFSGWMKYETEFNADGASAIDLGQVGECVHAWLNDVDLGERICPPYIYDISQAVKPVKNRLVLEITNNLVHQHMDFFSQFLQIAPSGLIGPVILLKQA